MGVLYLGRHMNLDVDVAVKCLEPGLIERDAEFVARFQREARLAARLNHPNVVRVYDVSESDGVHYLILEYVDGEDAFQRMGRKGPLPEPQALQIIRSAANGLAEAHRNGLVHRDIKPANLMISVRGEVKVADLGLARALSGQTGITMEKSLMGTPQYMPPEQWEDARSAGPPADVWALGATLYFLLAGEDAIQGDGAYQIMNRLLKDPFPDIRERRPDVSEETARIIRRSARRDPGERYPTAAEMLVELEEVTGEARVDLEDPEWVAERGTVVMIAPPTTDVMDRIKRTSKPGESIPERVALDARRTVVLDAAETGRVRHNLPSFSTPFIGRDTERGDIVGLLENPECRLLTLTGAGGIGKTRLAVQAASGMVQAFSQGVFFVALAPVSSIEFFVQAVADAIGFTFFGREEPEVQILNYVREKAMLLVMDNFEHLMDSADFLMEMLQTGPGVKFLVTSRERLNLHGEWVREIEGMDLPDDESADGFDEYSAVKLYLQNIQRVRPGYTLTPKEKTDILRICRMVDGMPLGIELAAAWGRSLSSGEIAAEIEKNRDFLATTMRGLPERHRSIRAVFEQSWRFLSPEEREVFKDLSVFRGGFEREAADRVVGASLTFLNGLVDKSLLRRTPSDRYEMQELLRQYAEEKLGEDTAGEKRVRDAHCDYFADFLHEREDRLRVERQRGALDEIGEEIENIRDAWHWAIRAGYSEPVERSIPALHRFYDTRSRFHEGEGAFGDAVETFQSHVESDPGDSGRRWILGGLMARHGLFSLYLGRYETARGILQEGLEMLHNHPNRAEYAFCLNNLGIVLYRLGERDEAERCYRESLEVCREVDDPYGVARSLNNLGMLANSRGEFTEARRLYQESLEILREIDDPYGIGRTLNNLGAVFLELGEYDEARDLYEESLVIWREMGDRRGVSSSLNNLGFFSYLTGDIARAKEKYAESLAIKREIGNRHGIAISLINLGGVASKLGEYDTSREWLEESLEICHEIGDRGIKVQSLNMLANTKLRMGEHPESRRLLRESLRTAAEIQSTPLILESLIGMADLRIEEGKGEDALEILYCALNHPGSIRETRDQAEDLLARVESRFSRETLDGARERAETRELLELVRTTLDIGDLESR
jgi:predicted ATPase/Tfp pilus assembly protein PilF